MSRVCQVTGKRPVTGNNVSHANNRTKRRFPAQPAREAFLESKAKVVGLGCVFLRKVCVLSTRKVLISFLQRCVPVA